MTNPRCSPRPYALLASCLVLFAAVAPAQLPPSIDLVDIQNPPPGVLILKPEHPLDLAGELWSSAETGVEGHRSESKRAAFGDFDGDGLTDIAVGSPRMDTQNNAPPTKSGIAHIVFGRRNFRSLPASQRVLNLRDTLHEHGQADVVIRRNEIGDALGYCVAAGDINGDGYDDLVLAAPEADQSPFFPLDSTGSPTDTRTDGGVVYVLFGSPHLRSPGGGVTEIDLTPVLGSVLADPAHPCGATVTGVTGFASLPLGVRARAILGAYSNDKTGASVATGDFDNDGFSDLIICALSPLDLGGAPPEEVCWDGGGHGGITWVVYGGPSIDEDQFPCGEVPRQFNRTIDPVDERGEAAPLRSFRCHTAA